MFLQQLDADRIVKYSTGDLAMAQGRHVTETVTLILIDCSRERGDGRCRQEECAAVPRRMLAPGGGSCGRQHPRTDGRTDGTRSGGGGKSVEHHLGLTGREKNRIFSRRQTGDK